MSDISTKIKQLIEYAIKAELICEEDRIYMTNSLMSALGVAEFVEPEAPVEEKCLEEILTEIVVVNKV